MTDPFFKPGEIRGEYRLVDERNQPLTDWAPCKIRSIDRRRGRVRIALPDEVAVGQRYEWRLDVYRSANPYGTLEVIQ